MAFQCSLLFLYRHRIFYFYSFCNRKFLFQEKLLQFRKAMRPDRFGDFAHRQLVFIFGIVPGREASGATLLRYFTAQRQRTDAEQTGADGIGNPRNRSRRTWLPEHCCQNQASHRRAASRGILIND